MATMSAVHPQPLEPQVVSDDLDYAYSGDSVTVERKRRFIEGYLQKASVYHGAQYAGIARQTVYRWLESDPAFAEAFSDCQDDTADVMETSVYERALGRNGRPDTLLAMFWLKAHRPKFRDKSTIDIQVVQDDLRELLTHNNRQLPAVTTDFIDGVHVSVEREHVAPVHEQKEDESQ